MQDVYCCTYYTLNKWEEFTACCYLTKLEWGSAWQAGSDAHHPTRIILFLCKPFDTARYHQMKSMFYCSGFSTVAGFAEHDKSLISFLSVCVIKVLLKWPFFFVSCAKTAFALFCWHKPCEMKKVKKMTDTTWRWRLGWLCWWVLSPLASKFCFCSTVLQGWCAKIAYNNHKLYVDVAVPPCWFMP